MTPLHGGTASGLQYITWTPVVVISQTQSTEFLTKIQILEYAKDIKYYFMTMNRYPGYEVVYGVLKWFKWFKQILDLLHTLRTFTSTIANLTHL